MRTRIANFLSWLASLAAGHKPDRKVALRMVRDPRLDPHRGGGYMTFGTVEQCDRARLIY